MHRPGRDEAESFSLAITFMQLGLAASVIAGADLPEGSAEVVGQNFANIAIGRMGRRPIAGLFLDLGHAIQGRRHARINGQRDAEYFLSRGVVAALNLGPAEVHRGQPVLVAAGGGAAGLPDRAPCVLPPSWPTTSLRTARASITSASLPASAQGR